MTEKKDKIEELFDRLFEKTTITIGEKLWLAIAVTYLLFKVG